MCISRSVQHLQIYFLDRLGTILLLQSLNVQPHELAFSNAKRTVISFARWPRGWLKAQHRTTGSSISGIITAAISYIKRPRFVLESLNVDACIITMDKTETRTRGGFRLALLESGYCSAARLTPVQPYLYNVATRIF